MSQKCICLKPVMKQEGHDGPGSLTLIIQCTAMQDNYSECNLHSVNNIFLHLA